RPNGFDDIGGWEKSRERSWCSVGQLSLVCGDELVPLQCLGFDFSPYLLLFRLELAPLVRDFVPSGVCGGNDIGGACVACKDGSIHLELKACDTCAGRPFKGLARVASK